MDVVEDVYKKNNYENEYNTFYTVNCFVFCWIYNA